MNDFYYGPVSSYAHINVWSSRFFSRFQCMCMFYVVRRNTSHGWACVWQVFRYLQNKIHSRFAEALLCSKILSLPKFCKERGSRVKTLVTGLLLRTTSQCSIKYEIFYWKSKVQFTQWVWTFCTSAWQHLLCGVTCVVGYVLHGGW